MLNGWTAGKDCANLHALMHWVMFVILLFLGPLSQFAAAVEVAFVEAYKDGKMIQLEPGGRFYHVAIRVGDQWLHAHPHKGVDAVADLEPYGHKFYFLRHDLIPEPAREWMQARLGMPFDRTYSWDNPQATYCTRIIAEYLGIQPRTMSFNGQHWLIPENVARGELSSRGKQGLSPDELYTELVNRGFTPVSRCEYLLENVL
jgi:hypothetical protein